MLWGRFDNERSTLNMYDNPHFKPGSGLADTDAVVAEAGLSSQSKNANQGEALYIINSAGIAYHPQLVAVYHQAAGGYTPKRDEIQPQRG